MPDTDSSTIDSERIEFELARLRGDRRQNLSNFPGFLPGGVRRLFYSPELCPVPRKQEEMDVKRETLGGGTERKLFADIDTIIIEEGIDQEAITEFLQGDLELGGGYRWDIDERVEDLLTICAGLWLKGYPFEIALY